MPSAWVTKEWSDSTDLDSRGRPKRRRKRCAEGTRGVKESDSFVVEWIDPRGKRCREKIRSRGRIGKRLADDRCAQVNSQLVLRQYGQGEQSKEPTWHEAKSRFIRDILPTKRTKATRRMLQGSVELFEALIKPSVMADVDDSAIERFVAARIKQKTREGTCVRSSTVNKDLRNLRSFLRKAHKWGLLERMPEIEMLDEIEPNKPSYTSAEFVSMYHACDAPARPRGIGTCSVKQWWQTLLVLFRETGMRRGEAVALEWAEIDFERRSITLDPAKTKTKQAKHYTFGETAEQHLRIFAEHKLPGESFVFPWPHDISCLNDDLAKIQAKAGLDLNRKELKFHAFRRTVGETTTELYGLTAAQYKLAHSTPAVTAKHYAKAAMRKVASQSLMPALDLSTRGRPN